MGGGISRCNWQSLAESLSTGWVFPAISSAGWQVSYQERVPAVTPWGLCHTPHSKEFPQIRREPCWESDAPAILVWTQRLPRTLTTTSPAEAHRELCLLSPLCSLPALRPSWSPLSIFTQWLCNCQPVPLLHLHLEQCWLHNPNSSWFLPSVLGSLIFWPLNEFMNSNSQGVG